MRRPALLIRLALLLAAGTLLSSPAANAAAIVVVPPTPPAPTPTPPTVTVTTPDTPATPTAATPVATVVPDAPAPAAAQPPASTSTTTEVIAASIGRLADSRINQFITSRVLNSILLGANEQVNGCNCVSAYGAFGSVSGGAHGRYALTDSLTLLAGASLSTHRDRGADVGLSPTFALSLRYDPADLGPNRPFAEIGTVLTPEEWVRYRRPYATSAGLAAGSANTTGSNYVGFVRVGYVARLSPQDEVAATAEYSRGWQRVRGYAEPNTVANPFPAFVAAGTDTVNIAKFGAQYTRLLTETIEANVSAGLGYAFDQRSGVNATILGAGFLGRPRLPNTVFFEGGGRVGFRIDERSIIDTFVVSAAGPQPIGTSVHGGIGYRYAF